MLLESASHRHSPARRASMFGHRSPSERRSSRGKSLTHVERSTNQSRLDRPAQLVYATPSRPRDNNRRNVYRRRRPTTRPAPPVLLHVRHREPIGPIHQSTKIELPVRRQLLLPLRHLFTLSMSRPRRRRRVECQFGITRLPVAAAERCGLPARHHARCWTPRNVTRRTRWGH